MAHSGNSNITASVVVGVGASGGAWRHWAPFWTRTRRFPRRVSGRHAPRTPAPEPSREISADNTSMRVVQAEDGMLLAPDSVYVLPPGMVMTVNEHTLRVLPTPPSERGHCDRSHVQLDGRGLRRASHRGRPLRHRRRRRAGSKAIKENGGLTIAQIEDGITPLFSGIRKARSPLARSTYSFPWQTWAGAWMPRSGRWVATPARRKGRRRSMRTPCARRSAP